jgi:hypothetical protein
MTERSPRQYGFLAVTTRGFALVALATASVLADDSTAVLAVFAIGCIWLAATAAERMDVPSNVTIPGEAALIGMASALALTESYQVLTVLGRLALSRHLWSNSPASR